MDLVAGVEAFQRPEPGSPPKKSVSEVGVGVDIGQKRDPTALCVAEVARKGEEFLLPIRHMETLPLGTPYPDVAARVAGVCEGVADRLGEAWARERDRAYGAVWRGDREDPALPPSPRVLLRIDGTGVGAPVVEMVREALSPRVKQMVKLTTCYFTHGDRLTRAAGGGLSVGKAYLVSRLQALMQSGRIRLPRTLAVAEDLMQELLDYEIRVSEDANDRYGAFKVGSHDDLVTALGLAVLREPPAPKLSGTFRDPYYG